MSRTSHRDALLAAAQRLLATKGYARTTARDLVAESGTNLASIGYHFGSKEALLNEAIGLSFLQWTERLDHIGREAGGGDPLQRLLASWRAMMDDFALARPLFVAFLEALPQAERSPELRAQLAEQYERLRATLAATVAEAIDVGEDDARHLGSLLIAVTDGLLLQWFLDVDRAASGDELTSSLLRALAAAPQV
jgi:AcrR family transcriptional regulator